MRLDIQRALLSAPYVKAKLRVLVGKDCMAALSLYDNPHIRIHEKPALLFGDLSLSEAVPAANALLMEGAEQEVRLMGYSMLLGPMNGSTWHSYRLPVTGDLPVFAGDLAMPTSWSRQLLASGYQHDASYHSSSAPIMECNASTLEEGLDIRPLHAENLEASLAPIHELCMLAFAKAPYFSPINQADFIKLYRQAAPAIAAGLSYTAWQATQLQAFIFAYPDVAKQAVVIKTIARHPKSPYIGLAKLLGDTVCVRARALGLRTAIHAYMHDDNRSVVRSQQYGSTVIRRYALFRKELS